MIESIFSSKIRIRILRILIKVREINITRLARDLGINYKVAVYHVEALRNMGLVEEKRFGRIRIVRLIENNPKVHTLERIFKELDE